MRSIDFSYLVSSSMFSQGDFCFLKNLLVKCLVNITNIHLSNKIMFTEKKIIFLN